MAFDTSGRSPGQRYRRAAAVAWAVVVPLALIGFLAVHVMSDGAKEPLSQAGSPHRESPTGHFLLAAATVLVACRIGGSLMRRLRQPAVMGEICAGLALGPALLGQVSPEAAHWLFPASSLPLLDGLAQLGLVLFMFGVGQELAHVRMRGTLTRAVLVTHASLLIPFAGGTAAAVALLATDSGTGGVRPVVFVLFVGCALSITAFPVLARILADLGRMRTEPGRLSLFAAAVGDGVGWLVLAALLAGARGGATPGGLLFDALGTLALVALFLGPVRRLLRRLPALNDGRTADIGTTTGLVAGIAATSALTAALGVHQLIGAMLAGLVWPVRRRPADQVARRLARSAASTLLPFFFFFEFGLHTDLSTLRWDGRTVLTLLGLTCLATVTKVVGPAVTARLTGMSWRSAYTLGVLLNARGLTELVVLQVGYQAGIIDERLLGILTLVALITTAMTSVLLHCGRAASQHGPRELRDQQDRLDQQDQRDSVGDEGMRTGQPV
ncbi:cation:proton antiporter [Streptomyces formicae]|uniref:Na(+)/H(+) antiporter n=1 Tax=Streptomyces formicae TaxID=1616117 RepID=A0A291Q3J6_9ACTN|nr:cation:proton antiporter [Streptomyces formicae]ATL26067.1 Na(+)/H(+) antiporter [Streptomyces formicae]